MTLLLLAIVYAAIAHGAFHAGELAVVVAIVAIALALAWAVERPCRGDLGAPTVAAAVLAAWYAGAAAIAGHVAGAGPAVGLLFVMAASVVILRRATDVEREQVVAGVVAIGAFVAWSGWWGVAFHHRPLAIEDNGLWRAASTITYANVTGAFVGAVALVALDRVLVAPGRGRVPMSLLGMSCIVGLAATASRGALVTFGIGLVVLAAWRRRNRIAALLSPVVGAAVATAALLPSMPSGAAARPAVALIGVALGCVIAVLPIRRALPLAAACVVVAALAPGLRADVRAAWKPIVTQRITTTSSDRSHERRAALDLVREHPVAGVGPGNVTLRWSVYYFVPVSFAVRYAHDEYLQVALESGLVGLATVAVGVGAVFVALARAARRAPGRGGVAGIAAALLMLALQSTTDFLWHVPLVPLAASILVGSVLAAGTESCGDSTRRWRVNRIFTREVDPRQPTARPERL